MRWGAFNKPSVGSDRHESPATSDRCLARREMGVPHPLGADLWVADHIDTPRVLQDAQGNTRWRWMAEPFGTTAPEEQPTASLPAVTFNLRMPGQLFEPFGGRFYNYFRDYDPSSGRYAQSDPIGLDGGVNTYAYAGGQPTSMVDRNGLFYTSVDLACMQDPSFCAEIMGQTIKNAGAVSGNKCLEAEANRTANGIENVGTALAVATLFKVPALGSGLPSIARIVPGSLPAAEEAAVVSTLNHIDAGTKPAGDLAKKWGTQFKNWAGDLPGAKGAASPYLEFRVAPSAGTTGAGKNRIVVNSQTGEVFYTWTHYGDAARPAFVQVR